MGEEICLQGIFPQADAGEDAQIWGETISAQVDAGVSDFGLGPFSLRVAWGYRICPRGIFGKGTQGTTDFTDSAFSVSGRRGERCGGFR